jgi:oligoendopeptidase F
MRYYPALWQEFENFRSLRRLSRKAPLWCCLDERQAQARHSNPEIAKIARYPSDRISRTPRQLLEKVMELCDPNGVTANSAKSRAPSQIAGDVRFGSEADITL